MDNRGEKRPPIFTTIIIINIIVYIVLAILSRNPFKINNDLLALVGQSNYLVLKGAYWQLITSLFVHANLLHLLGNMFFLLIFGLRAEEVFSISERLIIYFSSGIVGNILTLLMGPYIISVGASGAIFGLFGATSTYIRKNLGQSIVGALIYSFYLLIFNIGENVNILSHAGGLAAGLIIGYSLGTFKKRDVS